MSFLFISKGVRPFIMYDNMYKNEVRNIARNIIATKNKFPKALKKMTASILKVFSVDYCIKASTL